MSDPTLKSDPDSHELELFFRDSPTTLDRSRGHAYSCLFSPSTQRPRAPSMTGFPVPVGSAPGFSQPLSGLRRPVTSRPYLMPFTPMGFHFDPLGRARLDVLVKLSHSIPAPIASNGSVSSKNRWSIKDEREHSNPEGAVRPFPEPAASSRFVPLPNLRIKENETEQVVS